MGADAEEFNAEAYSEALSESLKAYALADAMTFGKLLTLRTPLAALMEEGKLTEQ